MEEVVSVKVVRPYILEIAFLDRKRQEIDLAEELHGAVFHPLKDPGVFQTGRG